MEYEIKPAKGLQFNVKELWDFRELIYFFTLRDIKIKYKQTVLGALWAILQPFLLMVIFTVFFASHLDIKSYNLPYPVFVFSGLILWNVFATGISTAGNSMIVNSNIIKKIYFPRLIIPISGILGTLVDFVMTLLMFVIVLFYYLPSFSLAFYCLISSTLFVHHPDDNIWIRLFTGSIECKVQGLQVYHSFHDSDLIISDSGDLSCDDNKK
jgi:lipopolysaccharide transport system permease protein